MRKRRRIDILGVRLDQINFQEALFQIEEMLIDRETAQIATINPEFIVQAQANQPFKDALNKTKLAVADGIGVRAAAKLLSLPKSRYPIIRLFQITLQGFFLIGPAVIFHPSYFNTLPETVTGVDLSQSIAKLASQRKKTLFFLGAAEGVAEEAAKKLKQANLGLKIAGCYAGTPKREDEEKIINMINKSQANILLVAYGTPAQEIWIARNINRFRQPIIAMGVGGTFDFIAERIKRAPKWIRSLNLEWLYRLIREPGKRAKRIYQATIVFPYLVWKNKLGL